MATAGRAGGWWDEAWSSCNLVLTFEDLDSTLGDLDGASGHGLLETYRLSEVDIGKAFALVNLDPVDGAQRLHGVPNECLGDTLGGIGMFEERLLAHGGRGW